MIITSEIDLRDFEGWSGGESTLTTLSYDQIDTLQFILEDAYPKGIDETHLNDILRFETDWIAEMLGFTDWESLERYNRYGDEVTVRIFNIEWDDDIEQPSEMNCTFDYTGDNDKLEEDIEDYLDGDAISFDYEILEV